MDNCIKLNQVSGPNLWILRYSKNMAGVLKYDFEITPKLSWLVIYARERERVSKKKEKRRGKRKRSRGKRRYKDRD
jgi:hypothetical protein